MGFKRDGITSNVEISGELDEIFERRGDHTNLEDLKHHLQNPNRQRELLQKWLHEQEHWMQKLPQLVETFQKEQKDLQSLVIMLEQIQTDQSAELEALLTFLELEDSEDNHVELLSQLKNSVTQYQAIRAKIAQEMPENSSQVSRILKDNPLAHKLEKTTEVEEAADPLDS
jgi:hypothetical protein